jgi:hypothetical protein
VVKGAAQNRIAARSRCFVVEHDTVRFPDAHGEPYLVLSEV